MITTSAIADSGNFAGPYIAVQATAAGIELDGQYNDPTEAKPKSDATLAFRTELSGLETTTV